MGQAPLRLTEELARAKVAGLLAAPTSPKARLFLTLAYASGLRLSELCQLRGCGIDSASDCMQEAQQPSRSPGSGLESCQ